MLDRYYWDQLRTNSKKVIVSIHYVELAAKEKSKLLSSYGILLSEEPHTVGRKRRIWLFFQKHPSFSALEYLNLCSEIRRILELSFQRAVYRINPEVFSNFFRGMLEKVLKNTLKKLLESFKILPRSNK